MVAESRETLSMESAESQQISFKQEKGCFLKYCTVFILVILYIASIIVTGLVVYVFWRPPACSENFEIVEQDPKITTEYVDFRKKDETMKAEKKEETPLTVEVPKKGTDESAMNMRLPRSITPLHYYMRLIPYINGNFSIDGYVELTFEVLEPTMNITLHINDMITKNDTIKVVPQSEPDGAGVPIKSHIYDRKRNFYIAKLNETLMKGKKYIIKMGYMAYLNHNNNGFYRSGYKDETGKTRWVAVTQFQPTYARQTFPCMDEPEFRTSYTVELGREKTMSSLSNMPLNDTVPMEGHKEWVWDRYEESVKMSTYLLAFAVCDFTYIETKDKSVPYDFRVWTRESVIAQANYSLDLGLAVTKFFEEFFHVPFPLPKQDSIGIPDKGGAMENWGLVTYGEWLLLHDPNTSSASEKLITAHVIAHELAHQWFGNLVTPTWWTDLWLNEGFASYMESVALKTVEPTFKEGETVVKDLHAVFPLDSLETSHPINIVVRNPNEIGSIFDRITYQKGSSIIRMMSHFLTEETFRKGLSKYLTALAFKTAEQDDLWRYLTKQAHEDGTLALDTTVKTIMDTWTLQMGFPVITVKKNNDGTATIMQERFLFKENNMSSHDYKWWIPITFTSQGNPDFYMTRPKEWMSPSESTKIIEGIPKDQWVIFNTQQTGFYRVNYEEENWKKIVRQLMSDHTVINTVNRAQLIDDSIALARAGLLSYEITFKVLSYLKKEMEYVPWKAALGSINFIQDMFSQTGGYGALKQFILSLIKPIYNEITFEDSLNDPLPKQLMRAAILKSACSLGHQPCIDEAVRVFNESMHDPNNKQIISPNLKHVVYCTGISQGGYKEWSFLWKRFKNSNVISEKRILLDALGCSKENWILSGYLKKAFTAGTGIRKHESRSVVGSIAKKDAGRPLVWEFLKDNWTHLLKYYGSGLHSWRSVFKACTHSLKTENEINELKQFIEKWKKYFSGERASKQAIENAENNLHWMNNNYQQVLDWLTETGYTNAI